MIENSKTNKICTVLIIILSTVAIGCGILYGAEFIDYWYMKATGDYLLAGGSLYTNPFTVNDLGIIVQQWLYCIFMAFVDRGGPVAIFLVVLFYILSYMTMCVIYARTHKVSGIIGYIISMITICVTGGYIYKIRPETISLILLALQMIFIENAVRKNKPAYFYGFIPIMLLEINIHGSVWFVHYLIILAYIFPNLFKKCTINDLIRDKKMLKHLGIASALMTASMLCNPYGYKMFAYTFITLKENVFSYITIIETMSPYTFSAVAICAYLLVGLIVAGCINKCLRVSSVYLASGFTLMTLMMNRNIMFITLGYLCVLVDFAVYFQAKKKVTITTTKQETVALSIVTLLACMVFSVFFYTDLFVNDFLSKGAPPKIVDYIDEHYDKDDHIYAAAGLGSYMEYRGYTNIFTDSRPEVYAKAINGKKDVLEEFDMYGHRLVIYEDEGKYFSNENVTGDRMQDFIDEYDFQCFMVTKYENALFYYLSFSDEYECTMSEEEVFLFERCVK